MTIAGGFAQAIGWRPRFSPRGRRLVTGLMLVACLYPSVAFGREYLLDYDRPGNALDPYTDAITYLAAGERLNAGHELYRLAPGDRPVLIMPGLFTAPLLSPPPIAAIWRPIAAWPGGFQAWVIACWLALLGTIGYLVIRTGFIGFAVALLLSQAVGEQLAVANVASFFPGLLVIAWRYRHNQLIGVCIGLMAGLKLSPVAMVGWLISDRRWRAIALATVTVVVLVVIGAVGAGIGSYFQYLGVASTVGPSYLSVNSLSGTTWMNYVVLAGGAVVAASLNRWPWASFVVAVVASVFGAPAVYLSTLVPLLAVAAPLIREQRQVPSIVRSFQPATSDPS